MEAVKNPIDASTRWSLVSLSLAMLMPSLDTSIANVALPTLARAFSTNFGHVRWIVVVYLLAITLLTVAVGRFGDVLGRRRLFLCGIVLFTVASAGCGIAPNLATLIAGRGIQGMGAAIMMTLALALVRDALPKEMTGRAVGLLAAMSAVGTTLGPSLGGVLIASLGWRALFLVNIPLGAFNAYLALQALRSEEPPLTSGLHKTDFLSMDALRRPWMRASLAANALVAVVMMTTLVVGPFYLARSLGLNVVLVGVVMSIGPLIATLSGVPAGALVDRFGAKRMVIIGLAGIALGLVLVALFSPGGGVFGYIAPIAIVTSHYALFQTANGTAIMAGVPNGQRGVFSGMLGLSRNAGLLTGASVMGTLFANFGINVTFGLAAALIGCALATILAIHRK